MISSTSTKESGKIKFLIKKNWDEDKSNNSQSCKGPSPQYNISLAAEMTELTANRSIFWLQNWKYIFKCQDEISVIIKKCNSSIYYYRDYQN